MKLEIFKPEDFISTKDLVTTRDVELHEVLKDWQRSFAAQQANEKLNKWLETNAKRVYSRREPANGLWTYHEQPGTSDTHQALVICIELIEKCKHPKEKVKRKTHEARIFIEEWYECECGAKLRPNSFEEIK